MTDPSPPQERESAPTPLGDCPPSIPHAAKIFELLDRWTPEQRAEVFYNIESRWCWHCGHEQAEDIHAECVATEMGLPPIAEIERREAAVERGEGVGGSEFFAAMREKLDHPITPNVQEDADLTPKTAPNPITPSERESADRERLIEWVEGRIESDPPQILGHDRRVVRLDMLKEVLAALRAAPSAPTREQVEALRKPPEPGVSYGVARPSYNQAINEVLALYGESAKQDS